MLYIGFRGECMRINKDTKQIKNKRIKQFSELKRAKRYSALFLLPSIIGVSIFFAIPFLVVVYYSFIDDPVNKQFVAFDK